MTIYYTAKDIEELAAKGIHSLELGPNTSLTDFARETAEQLDIALIEDGQDEQRPKQEVVSRPAPQANSGSLRVSYNKPRGCQHGIQEAPAQAAGEQRVVNTDLENATPVSRLVDLMGKIINRGD
jgi:hypothetical protein